MKKKLTTRENRFVKEYFLKKFNGTRAAIAAGYSAKSAYHTGYENLKKPHIQLAIEKELKKWEQVADVEIKDIIQELKIVAFSDLQHYVTIDKDTGAIQAKGFEDMPPNASRALESISEDRIIHENKDGTQIIVNDKRKFKTHSKIEALKLLANIKGMTREKDDQKGMTIIINAEPHNQ